MTHLKNANTELKQMKWVTEKEVREDKAFISIIKEKIWVASLPLPKPPPSTLPVQADTLPKTIPHDDPESKEDVSFTRSLLIDGYPCLLIINHERTWAWCLYTAHFWDWVDSLTIKVTGIWKSYNPTEELKKLSYDGDWFYMSKERKMTTFSESSSRSEVRKPTRRKKSYL